MIFNLFYRQKFFNNVFSRNFQEFPVLGKGRLMVDEVEKIFSSCHEVEELFSSCHEVEEFIFLLAMR